MRRFRLEGTRRTELLQKRCQPRREQASHVCAALEGDWLIAADSWERAACESVLPADPLSPSPCLGWLHGRVHGVWLSCCSMRAHRLTRSGTGLLEVFRFSRRWTG